MVDANDDAKAEMYRRIEPPTGPGRRRQWSEGAKARIVSEAMQPGAVVAVVARRWQVCPQQVFGWAGTGVMEIVPVVRRMREILLGSARLFADKTTMPVLDPGREGLRGGPR